jgi:hypothetical protein
MIPNKARATATGFHCGAVAIHVVAGERISVIEEFGELWNSEEIKVRCRIVNCVGNIVDVLNIPLVDEFEADCTLIPLTTLTRLDSVDLYLHRNQRTGEKRPIVGDDACGGVVHDEGNSVRLERD